MYDGFLRQKTKCHGDSFPGFNEIYKPINNDMIYQIFPVNCELKKSAHLQEFLNVQCKILSKDHTFKAAASINFMKDGQWVKQYDSLYCAK